jgi:hypothetical protein
MNTYLMITDHDKTLGKVSLESTILGQTKLASDGSIPADNDLRWCKEICKTVADNTEELLRLCHPCIVVVFVEKVEWNTNELCGMYARMVSMYWMNSPIVHTQEM